MINSSLALGENYRRILVTGGAGFIGGALVRRLLSDKRIKVFNLDKIGYASDLTGIDKALRALGPDANKRYEFLKVDLADSQATNAAFSYVNPDLVFHFAAESHVDRSIDSPYSFLESNIIGTFNLLQAARTFCENITQDRRSLFKVHHISTDEVFGSLGNHGFFSESTPYDPRSPYSASKAASDHLVNAWYHTYKLPVVITNCSNNYGPWQFPEKLIPLVILKAINGEPIPIYGDGSNVRDWLFVEDHIDAIILVANNGRLGAKYCVGGFDESSASNEYSNQKLVETICGLLDQRLSIKSSCANLITYVKDRPGHDHRYAIDSSLIKKELGWYPSHSLSEGLANTVDWYLENLDWCQQVRQRSGYCGERIGLQDDLLL